MSDDTFVSHQGLAHMITRKRAGTISQLKNDSHRFTDRMYQKLGCIEVEELDIQQCPCAPVTGCTWYRTKSPVPLPLVTQTVSDTTGRIPYDYIGWTGARGIPEKQPVSARKAKYYTFQPTGSGEVHIYLYSDTPIKLFSMVAVFDKPLEAEIFPSCGDEDRAMKAKCSPMDIPIYLDPSFVDLIIDEISQGLLAKKRAAPEDNQNNDIPDPQPAPVKP